MRFTVIASLVCLSPVFASAAPPPLIDRQLFFGDPEISASQISPDGQFIAFMKPLDGTRNVWVKKVAEPFSAAHPVTADKTRPIAAYFWSRDSKYILFAQDKAGDENFNVFAVSPTAPPAAGSNVPAARNLTDIKGVRAEIYSVPRTMPDIIYVGLNDRDKAWHDLYEVRISTGERKLLRTNNDRLTGWVFDLKDQLRLATRSADNGDTEVLRVDGDKFTKVYSCGVMESCSPVQFHKDGKRVYMMTNQGSGTNLLELVLFDPETQTQQVVESDPEGRVDLEEPLFSEVSDSLIATVYINEKRKIYWKDKGYESDYRWLEKQLPGKQVTFGSHTRDETEMAGLRAGGY